ncbi:uncharacterized protein STEHIDRAFT_159070 [Stereum hirsutum FP-91666 SS1]|uniref:uncharacterized protein n=1 Tax=Stereum hirsutum (strain FP-91666) TaxID=721885 RepID=UPI000444A70E|nr:uncharacterized protein STEHIDRAFT_159070 [Stereum hirsutum FP-91666 SS1]EIM84394.1 hypothetical protein STEHIDRAFT_159070 [Stereum hirsutum FP-91666 SS1]
MFLFAAANTPGVTVSRLLDYGIRTAGTTTFSAAFPVIYAEAQALQVHDNFIDFDAPNPTFGQSQGYKSISRYLDFFWLFRVTHATPSKGITIDLTLTYPSAPTAPCKHKPNAVRPPSQPDLSSARVQSNSNPSPRPMNPTRLSSLLAPLSSNTFRAAVDSGTKRDHPLAACVRTLRATIDPSQPFRLLPRSFALATTKCPNLKGIDLTLYLWPTHSPRCPSKCSRLPSQLRPVEETDDEKTLSILHGT